MELGDWQAWSWAVKDGKVDRSLCAIEYQLEGRGR